MWPDVPVRYMGERWHENAARLWTASSANPSVWPLQPLAVLYSGVVRERRADFTSGLQPPGSPGHPLGTDQLGRDLLARVLHGARLALFIGVCTVVITALVGGLLGLVAKGNYDDARSRCADAPRACPSGAVADADSAYNLATGATVAFIVGAALFAGGATLFALSPDGFGRTSAKATSTSRVSLGAGGFGARW